MRPSAKVGCVVVGENYTWLENIYMKYGDTVRGSSKISEGAESPVSYMDESCPMYE